MSSSRGRLNRMRGGNHRNNLQPPRRDHIRQRREVIQEISTTKRRLLKMIVAIPQPLGSTENKSFKDFMKGLNPPVEIPTQSVMRSLLVRVYSEIRNELQSSLKEPEDVVLTCESWSHRVKDSFLTVSCHFVDNHGNLKSYVLSTKYLLRDESADNIIKQISAVVKAWGLEGKVHAVVRAGLPQLKGVRTKWTDMPCFAETLNVVFQDLMSNDELSSVFKKCQDIVRFFKLDSEAEKKLRKIQKKLNMEQNELKVSSGDNWLLWFNMLEGLTLQRVAIEMYFVQENKKDLILDENETVKLENITSVLKHLKKVTSMMNKEGFQSISVMLPLLTTLMDDLREEEKRGNEVAKILLSNCKKHIGNVNNHPLAFNTFLDPRYKDQLGEQNKNRVKNKIMQDLTPAPEAPSTHNPDELLHSYTAYTPTSEKSNPLAWWRNTGKTKFGELSKLALKKLGVVSTAVPLERAFSTTGDHFCNQRSAIEPENLDMILFLNSNWPAMSQTQVCEPR
ncbi:zinc finger BED domain-containing protein DAYSLEEPER [Cheilinus undulatus]|uniref:zinc finger BED domain-containing protein DAYSLEEPER n=1 Tax=Cheilinus undulatus TaxID=241271 RepID=UPI001BD4D229|nr:zinc finger BED domain-containing protein DAYSLEEPER [Cheilinus undulatus]